MGKPFTAGLALEAGRLGSWEWDVQTEKVQWSPGLEVIRGRAAGGAPQTFEGVLADIHSEEHSIETVCLAAPKKQSGERHALQPECEIKIQCARPST